jgi:flagellar protein FlaJ
MKRVPFVPFPLEKASKISKIFLFISGKLVKFSPSLSQKLLQADIKIVDREYLAVAIFSALFWFLLTFSLFTFLGSFQIKNVINLSLVFSGLIGGIAFVYISFYPNLILAKKNRDIDRNLLFATRHLFIQVRSGVSVFDGLVSVSRGNYGLISDEFARCTKEIATGKEDSVALEEMAYMTPNMSFKRVLWQIVNSLKAGSDIGNTLNMLAKDLSDDQKVKIRNYGSQLSPMALMYLMSTVILPTLGITFLIIFSTFSGIEVPDTLFYMIMLVLAVFQFMFIGLIKNRRPSVEV